MPSDRFDESFYSNTSDHERRQQSPSMTKPTPKILSLILRAIIMSLITSVFFLFVGVAAIFLTHLFLAGRHRRQTHFPASRISNENLHQLPGFRFDGGSEMDSGSECVICLDRIRVGDLFRILPSCSHEFHLDCIDTWLLKSPVCPICRRRVCAGAEIGAYDEYKQLSTVRA